MKTWTKETFIGGLVAVGVLLLGALLAAGCDLGGDSAGITDGDGSVTLEISFNADGTMSRQDNGVAAAIEAGNPVRVIGRGVNGEVLYDVTGSNVTDLMDNLLSVVESVEPGGLSVSMEGMLDDIPTLEEIEAMSPEELAAAREHLRNIANGADPLRGNK